MENIEHQNVPVSMSYLISSMSQALAASENDSFYSFQNLLDNGLMPIDNEVYGHGLHGAVHYSMLSSSSPRLSPRAQSPVQWIDPTTLSSLCFLPSSPDAQLQHQQLQPHCHAHEQQLQPHQHGTSNNHYHHHHQQQLQQRQQHYQQQQAPEHYSLPPHNHAIQQQHQQLYLLQQQHFYSEKGICSLEMRSLPSSTPIRDISSPSMISLPYHHPTKVLLNRPTMPVAQLSMEFSANRSVSIDRLSSPEAPSPVSDQGFFEITTDEETASGCHSPQLLTYKTHLNNNNNNNDNNKDKNETIAMEQLNSSGSVPTTLPQRRRRTPPSLVHKSIPTTTLEQIMLLSPHATTAALTAGPAMMSSSSSSSLPTMPTLSSPLKQHFSFSTSMSDLDTLGGEEEGLRKKDFSPSSSPTSVAAAAAAKKRRERKPAKSGHKIPKHPPVKLPVCCVSLTRHAEAHKWRGLYAPVRCEACQSALSNEFSVQRHIIRSQPNSRCYRLRVYSIMMSETEIDTSVRFYPKRAHGKKTVEINLMYARARYLGDSPL
ncbi:hypothetical protein KI688_008071 [Linnemannia hyalina]|uniref:Uncharacterized protein n=1 Tax=Linnemannia hyalina TaxID=64524 RepID=A0A9P7Y1G0_9FUNG|nr:hypothetical protein KI688_008071 [Linnemannia hyalina]